MKEPKFDKKSSNPLLDRFVNEGFRFRCHLAADCEGNPARDMIVRITKMEACTNDKYFYLYAFVDEETGDSFTFEFKDVQWNCLYNGFTLNRYNWGTERSATLRVTK